MNNSIRNYALKSLKNNFYEENLYIIAVFFMFFRGASPLHPPFGVIWGYFLYFSGGDPLHPPFGGNLELVAHNLKSDASLSELISIRS